MVVEIGRLVGYRGASEEEPERIRASGFQNDARFFGSVAVGISEIVTLVIDDGAPRTRCDPRCQLIRGHDDTGLCSLCLLARLDDFHFGRELWSPCSELLQPGVSDDRRRYDENAPEPLVKEAEAFNGGGRLPQTWA